MSGKPSGDLRVRVARAAAVLCSLALGGFVIVNAQLGCDSQGSAPPAADSKTPAKVEQPAAELAPATVKQAEDAPAEPGAEVEPAPTPEPVAAPAPEPSERVYMPASKSAGDFDSLPNLNPAPQQAQPQQRAQQQAPQP